MRIADIPAEEKSKWFFKEPYSEFLRPSKMANKLGIKPNVLYACGLKQAKVVQKKGKLQVRYFNAGVEVPNTWRNPNPRDLDQALSRFFDHLSIDLLGDVNMFWDEGIYPSEHYD